MESFKYDSYQDVRRNLFKYSIPVLIVAGFFWYLYILPPKHREIANILLKHLSEEQPWKGILGSVTGVTVFSCIAFILTEIFQIHDHWYDKYIIRWRYSYAVDFIIPRLVQPFASSLNERFYEEAEKHTAKFQEDLFYPFVGDRDSKIGKNKIVRFYEAVTLYWLTQINEIVIFILMLSVGFYRIYGPCDHSYISSLLNDFIILVICFLFNRLAVRWTRSQVRQATAEEIRAIHADHTLTSDLDKRLRKLCADYNIPYNE